MEVTGVTRLTGDMTADDGVQVAAFYKFIPLKDLDGLRRDILDCCDTRGLLGTVLLASEGINGTVAGPADGVAGLFGLFGRTAGLGDIVPKLSYCGENPFHRMKVKLKKEIVTLGVEGIDPLAQAGEYVAPEDWNDLLGRPGVRVIDTRNDYEVSLGSFKGAENPRTRSFREFPAWVERNLGGDRDQPLAMFCTGGIRCEKSTAYLKSLGYKNVYHLEGGILNYLERVPAAQSLWRGDCFVFDNRVTVDHDLGEGRYELCPACRMPLSEEDKQSPHYVKHVSCPKCYERLTPGRRAGLEERGRQVELAAARGVKHIGRL